MTHEVSYLLREKLFSQNSEHDATQSSYSAVDILQNPDVLNPDSQKTMSTSPGFLESQHILQCQSCSRTAWAFHGSKRNLAWVQIGPVLLTVLFSYMCQQGSKFPEWCRGFLDQCPAWENGVLIYCGRQSACSEACVRHSWGGGKYQILLPGPTKFKLPDGWMSFNHWITQFIVLHNVALWIQFFWLQKA